MWRRWCQRSLGLWCCSILHMQSVLTGYCSLSLCSARFWWPPIPLFQECKRCQLKLRLHQPACARSEHQAVWAGSTRSCRHCGAPPLRSPPSPPSQWWLAQDSYVGHYLPPHNTPFTEDCSPRSLARSWVHATSAMEISNKKCDKLSSIITALIWMIDYMQTLNHSTDNWGSMTSLSLWSCDLGTNDKDKNENMTWRQIIDVILVEDAKLKLYSYEWFVERPRPRTWQYLHTASPPISWWQQNKQTS